MAMWGSFSWSPPSSRRDRTGEKVRPSRRQLVLNSAVETRRFQPARKACPSRRADATQGRITVEELLEAHSLASLASTRSDGAGADLLTEIGCDPSAFTPEDDFVAWLRL